MGNPAVESPEKGKYVDVSPKDECDKQQGLKGRAGRAPVVFATVTFLPLLSL